MLLFPSSTCLPGCSLVVFQFIWQRHVLRLDDSRMQISNHRYWNRGCALPCVWMPMVRPSLVQHPAQQVNLSAAGLLVRQVRPGIAFCLPLDGAKTPILRHSNFWWWRPGQMPMQCSLGHPSFPHFYQGPSTTGPSQLNPAANAEGDLGICLLRHGPGVPKNWHRRLHHWDRIF